MIAAERETNQGTLLVLDAGGALFPQWVALQSEGRVIVEAMNAMGYDAMGVGALDGVKGLDVLLARRDEATFPVLSANLVYKADKALLFEPSAIIERNGVRIGIIGVTDPDILVTPGFVDAVETLDATTAVKEQVDALRGQVDLVVLLSSLGLDQDRMIAGTVPGIDVIVGGRTRELMDAPAQINDTLIVQVGYRGEWLGRLKARFDAAGHPSDATLEALALDESYPEDPAVAALVAPYRQQYPTPTSPPPAPTAASTPTR